MPAFSGIPALVSRAGAATVLTAATVTASMLLPGVSGEAQAATPGQTALKVAASKQGSPYEYGAAGPNRFDCSGLTLYSFKKAGKSLPRTAADQYNTTRHISAGSRQLGDLVFFHSGSDVYHVGIYAGEGKIWHSPKPGASVRLEKIWNSGVWYGRVS
ncbi:C40 family peptidase [Streptomyces sp. UNOC14_S4]|uniref:C40 family peptidase n=1 Tax=Streptomyces sp. UNOC14_S4 TaxID=2872340 RepID=UPI001E603116|nr:C40 family peptidase [Streptomyces sp. UNOC14_S4]MCC3770331.1 C40 family peptidase [Streptomyces sp. UNOC14_S4]